jgi:hypothetical protein
MDVVKCLKKISHEAIFEKTPLTNKYLFILKAWCKAPIIGPDTVKGNTIAIYPTEGLPHGSIISPILCNIVLDGLQDFIQDQLPERYHRSEKEIRDLHSKISNSIKIKTSGNLSLFCVRYVDDILILAKCSIEEAMKMQKLLVDFLSNIGLKIENSSEFQGKLFEPGNSFEYLGFKFIYPDLKKYKTFTRGKYTKFRITPITLARDVKSMYSNSGIFLLISKFSLQKFKDRLKKQLSKKHSYLEVVRMIDSLNIMIQVFLNYYNLTYTIYSQLLPINDLLYKSFYKYLLRKYSSVPKIYTYIKKNFKNGDRFSSNRKILLKMNEIKPLDFVVPSNKYLASNLYLDSGVFDIKPKIVFSSKNID